MCRIVSLFAVRLVSILLGLIDDILRFGIGLTKSRTALVAENLFLRKQLAFYRERKVKPLRLTDSARLSLLFWSRCFDWRDALVVVKPGIPSVLALEVTRRQAETPERPASTDRRDGSGESDVG